MKKTIITAALTGAITPAGYHIPEQPEEIAAQVYECRKLGAFFFFIFIFIEIPPQLCYYMRTEQREKP